MLLVNRKHFGDQRCPFKYDLVRRVIKFVPGLAGFTLILMMTGIPESQSRIPGRKTIWEKQLRPAKRGCRIPFFFIILHICSLLRAILNISR